MADKFDPQRWLMGTLLALVLTFGGAVYNSLAATQRKVEEHAERLAKLEAIQETLKDILKQLTQEQRDHGASR